MLYNYIKIYSTRERGQGHNDLKWVLRKQLFYVEIPEVRMRVNLEWGENKDRSSPS